MSTPRTVVVTGGSRGIGKAICLAMADDQTNIFFNYVSHQEAARAVEKELKSAGVLACQGIQADVADEEQVQAFVERILEVTGRIDVLVNNAGITRDGLLVRMKSADWDSVLSTNLKGAFHTMKLVAKTMMKQRAGSIINISSIVGFSGSPGQANYVASKAGLVGLTKAVANELASRNITVNAVAPGYIETDMTDAISDKAKEAMLTRIPLKRAGSPDDVAGAVAFLASDAAAYITGQVIHVNGGMYV
jgi:3-oxoacyl-[acyl-carrier protein] reductase